MLRALLSPLVVVAVANAQGPAIVNLPQDARNLNVNFSDNYSLSTRSGTCVFKHAKVAEVAGIVQRGLSKYGTASINEPLNMLVVTDEKEKLANLLALCQQLDDPRMAGFARITEKRFELKYVQPSSLGRFIAPKLSSEGSLHEDNAYNAIWVYDHPSKIAEISNLVAAYDLPMKQILIDVEIIDVSLQGLTEAGLDWDELLKSTAIGVDAFTSRVGARSEINTNSRGSASEWSVSAGAGINIVQLKNVVRFLNEKGIAKVSSSPKLLTVNNKTSNIWLGKDIRYHAPVYGQAGIYQPGLSGMINEAVVRKSDTINTGSYGLGNYSNNGNMIHSNPPSGPGYSSERVSGLNLDITPSIGSGDIFHLNIDCELTDIAGWTDNDQPIIQGQSIKSNVIVKQNESFLLGQLNKKVKIEKTSKVPLLGSILPFLFSRKIAMEEESKVLILVTPHLIDNDSYGLSAAAKDSLSGFPKAK